MTEMNAYDLVAREYYDETMHPTCANLHDATRIGVSTLASVFVASGKDFCEVGSGQSMLADVAPGIKNGIVSIDLNWNMLIRSNGLRVLGDATNLPFAAETFDGVFGSLADPYNVPDFHREASRVLRPNGQLMFSVPSVDWVRHNQHREGLAGVGAVFRMQDGAEVRLPSFVYGHAEQQAQLEAAGFCDVVRCPVTWRELGDREVSARFRDEAGKLVSPVVVDIYIARVRKGGHDDPALTGGNLGVSATGPAQRLAPQHRTSD